MAIRFRFRSSLNFDSVDIEGRPSISVRDLKSKIIRQKNLNICQDFDLVFSDALTGQEYVDGNFQIPNGSSVIIKRVPAESVHENIDRPRISAYANIENKDTMKTNLSVAPNIEILDFDDFGVDLYPAPGTTFSGSDLDDDKKTWVFDYNPNIGTARYCERPVGGYQKIEASELSEAIPRGPDNEAKCNSSHKKLKTEDQEDRALEKVETTNPPAMQTDDLPSELKCSLCNSFFKAAVMIPCCQHSFCEKCIYEELLEKATCPKCFSTKCRVEDLLPNVSLRQAIEHFLESQIITTGLGIDYQRYAPDGESGIQEKDVSCGVSILQREPEFPHSPSGTGKGSNYIMTDSLPRKTNPSSHSGANNLWKLPALSSKIKQTDKSRHEYSVALDDFQGESQPVQEEAESTMNKKREPWVNNTAGGEKSFVETGRMKKGPRTCYMCGSPEHFIRDCPAALSPHPMLQTGNTIFPGAMPSYMPYWNGAPWPHVRPFGNLYGNPGIMPFNTNMVPAAPFVPTYVSSMYGPVRAFGRCMRLGAVAPPHAGGDQSLSNSEFLDVQDCKKRQKLSNEDVRRELCNDEDKKHHNFSENGRSHDHKSRISREKNLSYSDCSSSERSQRKYSRHNHKDDDIDTADEYHQKSYRSSIGGRDQRGNNQPERISSEIDDMPCSSSWHSEDRHKHRRKSSKKDNRRREQYGSDSSQDHRRREQYGSDYSRDRYQTNNKNDHKRRIIEYDVKRHNENITATPDSGLDQSASNDHKRRKKEAGPSSKHSQHYSKSNKDELSHERWQMIGGSDEDGAKECPYYKLKRGH
ncbi:hypothetical protein FNV43_RR11281 [Rhamnella rubrinervis]|uniref:Uncharacterized protein n=1 Tax=Rhamnella rubrinervis TaxID=2594499 RepID=A0A8K0H592_9ROSA|nr:hypothetical protein FNV43_RR11281 [Rhamnella rubrinervis]